MTDEEVRKTAALAEAYGREAYDAGVSLLTLLASHLNLMAFRILSDAHQQERSAIQQGRRILERLYAENLHLGDVARMVGMSSPHFSRVFHRETGRTFSSYLAELRVTALKRLLRNSRVTIAQAAFQSGFQSVSQANRVFRTATGTCPRRFRKGLRR